MTRIGYVLLTLAAIYLVIGISLGIAMGVAHDFRLAPLHAHINLVGWVTHGLMGLSFIAWPQLATCRTAPFQVWIFGLSAPVFLVGLVFALLREQPLLAIVGSFGVFTGVVMFALLALRALRMGREDVVSRAAAE
jgi:hypothetical protein